MKYEGRWFHGVAMDIWVGILPTFFVVVVANWLATLSQIGDHHHLFRGCYCSTVCPYNHAFGQLYGCYVMTLSHHYPSLFPAPRPLLLRPANRASPLGVLGVLGG
jgi:hypothetical protein